jgi:hypothetical protein
MGSDYIPWQAWYFIGMWFSPVVLLLIFIMLDDFFTKKHKFKKTKNDIKNDRGYIY